MAKTLRKIQKPKRAYVFWFFLILAIPLAIFILGYASGYRLDKTSRTIIKTSALSIYTTPSNAHITINGELLDNTTPFIQTFQPGTYHVVVSKEGYHSWETTTTLDTNTSALFADVVLFPQSQLTLEESSPKKEQMLRLATDEEMHTLSSATFVALDDAVLLLSGPQTLVIDETKKTYAVFDTALDTLFYAASGSVVAAEWHEDTLLIATTHEIVTYNKNRNDVSLVTRQATSIRDALFTSNGAHVIFVDALGLHAIEAYPNNVHARTQLSAEKDMINIRIAKDPERVYMDISGKTFSLNLE
ncbi:MAG: PEGA domain-containing protein [Candidatus Kerfeldbacteria bacterium]|nr:PEGA domain-containing protein [Candidatus Kerfeldbacteria bacterium]